MAKDGAPEHVGSGICAVAASVLVAKDVTREEHDLAELILARKFPRNDNPRELEFAATAFNRQMDAAIDACNRSHKADSRVTRRAALARDLDRAGLVILDRDMVAALIAKAREAEACDVHPLVVVGTLEIEGATGEQDGHDLGEELVDDGPMPGHVWFDEAGEIPIAAFMEAAGGHYATCDYSDPTVND